MYSYGARHSPDIEEAVNDAAQTVHQRIADFCDTKGTLYNWFLGIAHNFLRKAMRKPRDQPLYISLREFGLATTLSTNDRPHTRTKSQRAQDDHDDLKHCIRKLSEMQIEIILSDLAEHDPVSDKVLAQRLGTSSNSIKSLRHKAHKRLARLITKRQLAMERYR